MVLKRCYPLFLHSPQVLIAIYCPSFTEEPPSWLYLSMGLGLFFYQTFDGIDGKQARRTGTGPSRGLVSDLPTCVVGLVSFWGGKADGM